MNILIIGTGWYGCHLALSLLKKGYKVTLIDKTNDFFKGSSSKNQNRLHLGFHYPRSETTIQECQKGYYRFLKEYPGISYTFYNNLYFIADDSLVTTTEFKTLYTRKKIYYETIKQKDKYICGVKDEHYRVDELYIDFKKVSDLFREKLSNNLFNISNPSLFHSIDTILDACPNKYDLVLNCTYNHLNPIDFENYEKFLTLIYEINFDEIKSYTIMDGQYFSIYPYIPEKKLYTVTCVSLSVLYTGNTPEYQETEDEIENKRYDIDKFIKKFIPKWDQLALYKTYFTSWKTKFITDTDDRSLKFNVEGNRVHMYGGKITGIFDAEDIVDAILKEKNNSFTGK